MPYCGEDIDRELLSYLGGIIDGEGSISIVKSIRRKTKSPSYSVRISVQMCDKEIPELFLKIFGGSLHKRDRDEKHSLSYQWVITNKKSIDFLKTIIPFIKISRKIETAILCLNFQSYITDLNQKFKELDNVELNYRELFYQKAKELNKRGR